ncbi:TPA: DUF927 domain-containing protein [Citrobacter farmeri]
MKTQSVSTISGAAIGRWPYILSALGIKVPSAGHHGACPACGGKDRFRLDDKAGRGTWFCNQCGHGDGLDLVRLVTGRKIKEVAGMVSEALALPEIQEKPALPARKKAAGKEAGAERYTRLRQQSCNGEPVYLTNKGLHGYSLPLLSQPLNLAGITFSSGSLLLPLTDISGNITGGQLINPDGDKSLLPGSQLSGAFIALTDLPAETPEQVIITEGFATALTVSLLTEGWIVAAVAATNLLKVTEQIRKRWPETRIILAGDNDLADGKENTGRIQAEKAAKAVDGWVTLPPVRHKAGGYHLKGESTDGKTTTMKVAASVCGGTDFWHTWRATGNALEGTASRRNDATLMLDEIREVDGREAGNIAYMLANGQGKARARTDGSVRETNRWNLLFLSTGELSLVEHAASAGERTYAGVEVRMIQIPSDSGKYGVFEELHGFSSGKTLAEHLEQHVANYHGAPFRDWLHCLTADLPELTSQAKALLKEYTRRLTPENAGNQVGRAVTRFALVAMAGELATKVGITGWPEGEAFRAAQSCLAAWMADRGHTANQEDKAALEQVRDFMTRNQFSRFADWNDDRNRPVSMMGFRKVDKGDNVTEPVVTFYVLPSGWKEICKGFDSRKVARLCVDAGWLKPGEDGRTQNSIRLPEIGLKRVYQFNTQVLGSAEPE